MFVTLRNRSAGLSRRSIASLVISVRRIGDDRRGGVAIIAGFAFPLLIGIVAISIVTSNVLYVRTNMQGALDAAVLAGVRDPNGPDSQIATAQKFFQANLSDHTNVTMPGITARFSLSNNVISGTATGAVMNPWAGILGLPETVPTQVTSSAIGSLGDLCVLGLNAFDTGAFDLNGNAKFIAPNCTVQANSSSAAGLTQEGQPIAVAKAFGVSGGHSGGNFTPVPIDGTPKIADPYVSLSFPPYDYCSDTKQPVNVNSDRTLLPGTYCGGVHIFSAKVILLPGIYVMNGGPFWVNGGANVTGDQVTIAFTGDGSTLWLSGNATMTVTSPVSGTYANMQFVQDRTQPINKLGTWFSVGGANGDGSTLKYDGVAYIPTQNWWVYGNAVVEGNSPSLAIVAEQIWTQGNATVKITTNNNRKVEIPFVPQLIAKIRLTQ